MNNFSKTVTGIALALATSTSLAGTLGDDSSDTSLVTLEVTDKVQISNISNIPMGEYNGTDATWSDGTSYCVFRNGGDQYRLKLTTDEGAFQVASATTGDTIPFTAQVDSDADASDGAAIAYDAWSANMNGASATDCSGADNGSIEVTFTQANLLAVSSGSDYKATITVFVEPI
ncbi:MAG: hypothetical protein JJ934_04055 [Pseudomonadales bacterium]|nr:hypothetical protein [Pseudomonadales bacterium]MBO6563597.1 hypothetical protein [Pseudomonadales bacterium]MBO6596739.1 hypothetical protein [Pseudomonadales bacterium]MBO6656040.1 hypothetical protein [Pseudomonadales bacterium]MBO6703407.1 hypothetical protein [Pseudomonadales bacterium]